MATNDKVRLTASSSYEAENAAYGTFDYSYLESAEVPRGINRLFCAVCHESDMHRYPKRPCCGALVCKDCMEGTIQTKLQDGLVYIPCPNPECDKVVDSTEVLSYLQGDLRDRYVRLRVEMKGKGNKKACPNCNYLTRHQLRKKSRFRDYKEDEVKISCVKCKHEWCFYCHAPWHRGIMCAENRKGDHRFHNWTRGFTASGNAHCHKCPTCGVYIQRSSGCNHMLCNRCETEFCYRCGGRFLEIPGIGSHYDELSVLGCKDNFLPDEPCKRKFIRGSYLGVKLTGLTGYPVLFIAGAIVVVLIGAVAIPLYFCYKGCLYHYRNKTRRYHRRSY